MPNNFETANVSFWQICMTTLGITGINYRQQNQVNFKNLKNHLEITTTKYLFL